MAELVSAKRLSKIWFDREDRLTVWHAVMQRSIDPPQPFRAKELYEELQPNASREEIGRELQDLIILGAIALLPEHGDKRSKYFQRTDSLLWPFINELAEETIELSSLDRP